jgi:hypothetical protein
MENKIFVSTLVIWNVLFIKLTQTEIEGKKIQCELSRGKIKKCHRESKVSRGFSHVV